jgi:ubiquinone/menaquinone biosynthesis C-methylase UbiE
MMQFFFRITDIFVTLDKKLDTYGIRPGFTVIDYGCGPGRYIRKASALVGPEGKVYAVDIHELALQAVDKLVAKHSLKNVTTAITDGKKVSLPGNLADLIYALDMFHMVRYPNDFLSELARICKPGSILILEDGHQPRKKARQKVQDSGSWEIISENRQHMVCKVRK